MVMYQGIDLGGDTEEKSEGQTPTLMIAGGVIALLAICVAGFMLLGSSGGDSNPNIVGQDELSSFMAEHPELRNKSKHSK